MFELYFCYYKGVVVYIGQGKRGRHKHCNSGCSHVYELNKIHFLEGEDVISVIVKKTFKSKDEAQVAEVDAIKKYKPRFNVVFTENNSRQESSQESNKIRHQLREYAFNARIVKSKIDRFNRIINELFDYYGYRVVFSKELILFNPDLYRRAGKKELIQLSRKVKYDGFGNAPEKSCQYLVKKALKELFDLDVK